MNIIVIIDTTNLEQSMLVAITNMLQGMGLVDPRVKNIEFTRDATQLRVEMPETLVSKTIDWLATRAVKASILE